MRILCTGCTGKRKSDKRGERSEASVVGGILRKEGKPEALHTRILLSRMFL